MTQTRDLTLRFGSPRQPRIRRPQRGVGVADTIVFDPAAGSVLEGEPVPAPPESVAVHREDPEARGYRFAVTRNAFTMDRLDRFQPPRLPGIRRRDRVRQPSSPEHAAVVRLPRGRYDLYDISPGADPAAIFRTENGKLAVRADRGSAGAEAALRRARRMGAFEYGVNAAPEGYSGLVANLKLSMIVGGGTSLSHRSAPALSLHRGGEQLLPLRPGRRQRRSPVPPRLQPRGGSARGLAFHLCAPHRGDLPGGPILCVGIVC